MNIYHPFFDKRSSPPEEETGLDEIIWVSELNIRFID